jgi:predicted site-specific integrase-resolvase
MFVSRASVAKHFGVTSETIKNWVNRGLLPAPTRSPSGRVIFDSEVIHPSPPVTDVTNVTLPGNQS